MRALFLGRIGQESTKSQMGSTDTCPQQTLPPNRVVRTGVGGTRSWRFL